MKILQRFIEFKNQNYGLEGVIRELLVPPTIVEPRDALGIEDYG